jgi:hypothetical protein
MSRLSEAQQQAVLRLAQPLQRHQRGEFFRQVGVAIAALPAPLGDGQVHRLAVDLQRRLLDPPLLDGTEDL